MLERRAARAVDRWIDAAKKWLPSEAEDPPSAVETAFTDDAQAYLESRSTGRFSSLDWLPGPWMWYRIRVDPSWKVELETTSRLVSGSQVAQLERLVWRRPDGSGGVRKGLVTYRVRDDRIHRVWYHAPAPLEEWVPTVSEPSYRRGGGPLIQVDGAHRNGHTPDGSYFPFAELLRRDGYRVRTWEGPFTSELLRDSVDVVVTANALPSRPEAERGTPWSRPVPSAFTDEEIAALVEWIRGGGVFLLVTDHRPAAGAAAELLDALGYEIRDGFVKDTAVTGPEVFRRTDGTLRDHPITRGRAGAERVDSVVTHTGSAFRPLDEQTEAATAPLLVLPETAVSVEPAEGRRTTEDTPRVPVAGWLQGAVRKLGEGRIGVFAEAAMFRILTPERGASRVGDNARLVRNLVRWLVTPVASSGSPAGSAAWAASLGPRGG